MPTDGSLVIRLTLGAIASVWAILGATFAFWEVAQNEQHEKTKMWFRKKWESLAQSRWLQAPELGIRFFLRFRQLLFKSLVRLSDLTMELTGLVAVTSLCVAVASILLLLLQFGFTGLIYALISVIVIGLLAALLLVGLRVITSSILEGWGMASMLLGTGVSLFLFMRVILAQDIRIAGVLAILLTPVLYFLGVMAFSLIAIVWDDSKAKPLLLHMLDKLSMRYTLRTLVELAAFSVPFSFLATILAMLLGSILEPEHWVPQTVQMLVSNFVCDAATLIATFFILERALQRPGYLRIPVAVLVDILFAAFFACCSLYFGLLFTDEAISVAQVLNVLLGKSQQGLAFEFGPCFWAMHTTFLPTFAYLSVIALAWVAKLLLILAEKFMGMGQEHKNPLKLTAALCILLAVVFGALATIGL